ncbi:uncharacterized protein E0L32_009189 [Thyridium curvatum]|uniref:Inheritance of peroxisomes protein 1 n=1 Tax=Thyridium curvatum TaxID=1093900 RepID=A0A507AXP2_9PEZI|nr:uncharacterized protein E0L32_009189 [Thyridium curvatum]TPX09588.1 hypothetical protein E0L32_009189 [Thyridium curvatum]
MDRPRPVGAPPLGPRRVFTAPVAATAPEPAGSPSTADGVVETLYVHPSAKIVAFTAGPRNFSISPRAGVPADIEPGSLPWSSQLERTIAVEIPVGDAESDQRAQTLRHVLDKVLQFEKTPCPFQRAFTVVLPERPQTPVKKRPWTPVQRTTPVQLPPTPVTPVETTPKPRNRDREPSPSLQLETPTKVSRDEADKYKSPPVKSLVESIELKIPEEKASPHPAMVDQQYLDEETASGQPEAVSALTPELDQEQESEVASTVSEAQPSPVLQQQTLEEEEKPLELPEPAPATVEPEQEEPRCEGMARPESIARDMHPETSPPTYQILPRLPKEQSESQEPERLPVMDMPRVQDEPAVLESVEEELGDSSPTTLEGTGLMRTTSKRLTSFARLQARRSVTAPPQLTLHSSPPSKTRRQPSASESSEATESNSPTESFHSVQSWLSPITPLPPSPPMSSTGDSPETFPYPHENIRLPKHVLAANQRDTSEATATPTQVEAWGLSPTGADILSIGSSSATSSVYEDPGKPILDSAVSPDATQDDTITLPQSTSDAPATTTATPSPRPEVRHRATTASISLSNRHRALSPLPPAANLFSPPAQRRVVSRPTTRLEAVRRIPSAIIHKTCEILLSPPSHLINLMLKVAARIAAGEWRGLVFGQGEAGEHIPVQWDYTDHGDAGMYPWAEEDDFSPAFRRRASVAPASGKIRQGDDEEGETRPSSSAGSGRSWEVD